MEYSISKLACPSGSASQESVILFAIIHDALTLVGTAGNVSGAVQDGGEYSLTPFTLIQRTL